MGEAINLVNSFKVEKVIFNCSEFNSLEKEYIKLTEFEKKLYKRNHARKGNFNLNKTAVKSGVKDLARFHNTRYKGLYNGETAYILKEKN